MVSQRRLIAIPCSDSRFGIQKSVDGTSRSPFIPDGCVRYCFSLALANCKTYLVFEVVLKAGKLIYSAAAAVSIRKMLKFVVGGSKCHSVTPHFSPSHATLSTTSLPSAAAFVEIEASVFEPAQKPRHSRETRESP